MRSLLICLALTLPAAWLSAAFVTVEIEPAAPSLDPQNVFFTGALDPRLPVGASAVLRVASGTRPLAIDNADDNVVIGPTQGGGPAVTVTDDLILTHLLGLFDLSDPQLEAADLNFDGVVNVADLVIVILFPSDQVFTGGDPTALVAARPDGSGPLDEESVVSSQGPKIVTHDGSFAGTFNVELVDNLMSLVPSTVAVRPGETFNVALQIDSMVGFSNTVGYSALIDFGSGLTPVESVGGAADNEDFAATPAFLFDGNRLTLIASAGTRSDTGEAVINVANFPATVSPSAQAGQVLLITILEAGSSLDLQTGGPIVAPTLKVIGCAVRVEPMR